MRLLVVEPQCPVWTAFCLPAFSVVLTVVLRFLGGGVCVLGHSREDPGWRRLLILPPVRSSAVLEMRILSL